MRDDEEDENKKSSSPYLDYQHDLSVSLELLQEPSHTDGARREEAKGADEVGDDEPALVCGELRGAVGDVDRVVEQRRVGVVKLEGAVAEHQVEVVAPGLWHERLSDGELITKKGKAEKTK
jgi:hypothetical protein